MSPYLCNSLWAFQSAEGMIRTFYPYRRLEREWGISTKSAHHIELPSLPWGVPTILAGCGFRNLAVPYLDYDSNFKELNIPPLFKHTGPDGSSIRVLMDHWACATAHYTQGASILKKPDTIEGKWIPHYASLGDAYPLRTILACGTHGDIRPTSGDQVRGFVNGIIRYNAQPEAPARLVNATHRQFWEHVDQAEKDRRFLSTVQGSFGHTWDLWPVSLAKYVANAREGERRFVAAETLLTVMCHGVSQFDAATQRDLRQAEWNWAMLSDHAWNGTTDENKRHNAELRKRWSEGLLDLADATQRRGWSAAGIKPSSDHLTLFNSLSIARRDVVGVEVQEGVSAVLADGRELPCQVVREDGKKKLYFVTPDVPGFSGRTFHVQRPGRQGSHLPFSGDAQAGSRSSRHVATPAAARLRATPSGIQSPFYRLRIDQKTGGVASLVHRPTDTELVRGDQAAALCQTVFFDGQDHTHNGVTTEVVALGPVLARVQVNGTCQGINVTTLITLYADLDRVDCDVRIHKPLATQQERLCQMFPLLDESATIRATSAGAMVRPQAQPAGDLLPGADPNRFAVSELINVAHDDVSVTVAPFDAFALRLDLDTLAFEALGNDQNYREVTKDQHGVTQFRFRYSMRAHLDGYNKAAAVCFARTATTPMLHVMGRLDAQALSPPRVTLDSERVVATCFKPADDRTLGDCILRLWEIAGLSGTTTIELDEYRKAITTDLLERNDKELPIVDGRVTLPLKAHGYRSLRLFPK